MANNEDQLETRMAQLSKALEYKREDPDYPFDEVESVDLLIKFIITLNDSEEGISDGLYLYLDEYGIIVNAEYFIKEDGDITIMTLSEDQVNIIMELFAGVFAVNVT